MGDAVRFCRLVSLVQIRKTTRRDDEASSNAPVQSSKHQVTSNAYPFKPIIRSGREYRGLRTRAKEPIGNGAVRRHVDM